MQGKHWVVQFKLVNCIGCEFYVNKAIRDPWASESRSVFFADFCLAVFPHCCLGQCPHLPMCSGHTLPTPCSFSIPSILQGLLKPLSQGLSWWPVCPESFLPCVSTQHKFGSWVSVGYVLILWLFMSPSPPHQIAHCSGAMTVSLSSSRYGA